MSTIVRGNMSRALMPGVNTWWGMGYTMYPDQYTQIFDIERSEQAFEEDVQIAPFGNAVVKDETGSVSYTTTQQGFKKRYEHITYGLGFAISREAVEDNLYMKLAKEYAMELGRSMKHTKEIICANIINRATNASYPTADGLALASTAHLLSKGGTFSNKFSTGTDLNEYALEQGLIGISQFVDDAGKKIAYKGRKLIVPPQLEYEAARILKSKLQNDTANNAINAIAATGMLPEGYTVNNYLTDTNAWLIKTDCPKGFRMFVRRPLEVTNDTVFDSENMKYKATERYSVGVTDVRCLYYSEGG